MKSGKWILLAAMAQVATASQLAWAQGGSAPASEEVDRSAEVQSTVSAGVPAIVPLPPPDSLAVRQPAAVSMEFGDFSFDDAPARAATVWLRSMYENHHTSGPGRTSSMLEPGGHWLHDIEVDIRRPMGENWTSEFSGVVRYTDTRRHDPQTWSLQRVQFVAYDSANHLTLGDYYATLSQYSFNRSIKGLGYQRTLSDASYLRVVGGSLHGRWNHVWQRVDDEPIDRNALGLRFQTAGDNYRLGFNLVSAKDRDNDPARTTEDTYRQILPAFDWEYRMDGGFRFSGEHAYARTRKQDVAGNRDNLNGTAHRVNADGALGNVRLRLRTERVGSDFYTMAGGAAVDRLRYYVRGDYRLTPVWNAFAAYDWSRNNLSGKLDASTGLPMSTTRTRVPEIGLDARGLFDRRSLSLTTSLRQRVVTVDSTPRSRTVSDRIFVSLADRFGEVSVRGEVEAMLNTRKDGARQSNDDYLYRFIVDSRHMLLDGRYDLRPFLTLERQEVEDPQSGRMVRTNGVRLDMRLLAPNDIAYGAGFEHRHIANNIPNGDNARQTRFDLSLDSRPQFLRGGTFRAEVGHANYRFGDTTKNYRERYIRFLADVPFEFGS